MNVRTPDLADLVSELPTAWKGDICKQDISASTAHPCPEWVRDWLAMLARSKCTSAQLPRELQELLVVPLAGGQLASPAYCKAKAALSTQQLEAVSSSGRPAAELLTAVGCLCIACPEADIFKSSCPIYSEPITTALTAAATREHLSLQQLLSAPRLRASEVDGICTVLSAIKLEEG